MRHPATGLSEGDLSRLTGSFSSTTSANNDNINNNDSLSSSTSSPTSAHTSKKCTENELYDNLPTQMVEKSIKTEISRPSLHVNPSENTIKKIERIKPTYLPEIIGPLDWQKSRKRKERLDSTSSSTHDPKLQRSNSEELVPTQTHKSERENHASTDGSSSDLLKRPLTDVIRRVSSEDFKKTSTYEAYLEKEVFQLTDKNNDSKPSKDNNDQNETDAMVAITLRQHYEPPDLKSEGTEVKEPWFNPCFTKDMIRRTRLDTSPARSQRFRTLISNVNNNHISNSQSTNNSKSRDSDDSECENERRRSSERFCKARAAAGRKSAGVVKKSNNTHFGISKHNPTRLSDENVYKYDLCSLKYERRGFISKKVCIGEKNLSDLNDNLIDFQQQSDLNKKIDSGSPKVDQDGYFTSKPTRIINIPNISTPQESLPWDRSVPEDQTPILSRRHILASSQGDKIDDAAKLSKVMPFPHNTLKQQSPVRLLESDLDSCVEGTEAFRVFTSLENFHTNEIIQPAMVNFQLPEDRIKQINKRLNAMKKKLSQLEIAFECRNGYKPSQVDRLNDKYMKNLISDLNKLRKERHEFKSDPMAAVGLKSSCVSSTEIKLEKLKATLDEIEKNLSEKRSELQRPEYLDELSADQLVQEKTALQHALLYLESLYGRPTTKEERDAVRPLYDRYRQLKRLVSRSVLVSATIGISDLPTILEHEAMVFEKTCFQHSSNNSTETTSSPNDCVPQSINVNDSIPITSTTTNISTEKLKETENSHENIVSMTIDQLWDYLERTREEKNILKRTIREYETCFEQENGRKMLKNDRRNIEDTYARYKEKKAKTRLLQALIKKHISR